MRILQLVAQTKVGGAENFGFALGSELARRGHEVLLLANRDNGPLLQRPLPPGMQARALRRESRLDPGILRFLGDALRNFRPEIIHAHSYEASVWGRLLGLLAPEAGVLVHIHSSRFVRNHSRLRILTDRVLFQRADRVIVLNDAQRDFLRKRIGLGSEMIETVPNGIDVAGFARPDGRPRAETAQSTRTVVCVASLTDVKNHAALLRAWVTVRAARPDLRLVLVGDGPLRSGLEALAASLGISDAVEFVGAQMEIRPYLWDADLFVLPSLNEALPLSVLEAMAAGLPIVASSVGAIPDIVRAPLCGLVVTPGDIAGLSAAIVGILQDPSEARRKGEAGANEVRQRYGLERCVDRIEEIYTAILRERAPLLSRITAPP